MGAMELPLLSRRFDTDFGGRRCTVYAAFVDRAALFEFPPKETPS